MDVLGLNVRGFMEKHREEVSEGDEGFYLVYLTDQKGVRNMEGSFNELICGV